MALIKRGMLAAFLVFPFLVGSAYAAPSAPLITDSKWETGELNVCYQNVTPGNTIILYIADYRQPNQYMARDTWIAQASTECYMTTFYENGQTIFHYIVQVDKDTFEISDPSPIVKQTPPVTVYVTNWPEMFNDLKNLFEDMKNKLDELATPSQKAQDDLKASIDGLKQAIGLPQVQNAGNGIVDGLNGAQPGMKPPIIEDNGRDTYTGGTSGPGLPPNTRNTDGLGLSSPNLDEGTDTELTMRIPFGVKQDGSLWYIKLFTKEQMDKLMWLGLLRSIGVAMIYILFGIWLVYRFSPQLKS